MIQERSKRLASLCEDIYHEVQARMWDKLDAHFRKQEAIAEGKEYGYNRLEEIAVQVVPNGNVHSQPEVWNEALHIVSRQLYEIPASERFCYLCWMMEMDDEGGAPTMEDAAQDMVGSWQLRLIQIYSTLI